MAEPKLMAKFHKERDLDCEIRLGRTFGFQYVEINDYVPSEHQRLPGFVIDARLLPRLIEELEDLQRQLGGGSRVPGQGQEVLAL